MPIKTINLQRVQYIPKQLEPGVLYLADEFGAAAHLCACGCGSKISTPIGPTDWSIKETSDGPTLYPSIGNWQLECKSHYWIRRGKIQWAGTWTDKQIIAGRHVERERARAYYDKIKSRRHGALQRAQDWLKRFRDR